MSDQPRHTSGVVLKTKDKTYFIPQKVLNGFAVEHSQGVEMLNKTTKTPTETHEAWSVNIDSDLARQVFIL
jgi:hypothetical protein